MSLLAEPQENLVRYLENLVANQNTGRLAGLRRGVNKPPGSVPEAYSQVVPFLWEGIVPWQESVLYHSATLFALWHQGNDRLSQNPPSNMGLSLKIYQNRSQSESVEKRFISLLKSRSEAVPHRLRHAVGLVKTMEVSVDWRNLIYDLTFWSHQDRFVQKKWSKSFWGAANEPQPEENNDQ